MADPIVNTDLPGTKDALQHNATRRSWAIGFTSLIFILLQSACTAFMAISGLRLLIGVGSLAAAAAGLRLLDSIHSGAIRIPMEILAAAGSAINLYAIWRIRSLRARPSSQWRMTPVSTATRRSERIQIALSLFTMALLVVEWVFHIHLQGSK